MNAQIGISDRAAIAQNGIFARDFAAATYGGSGFGGGAATGGGPGLRPAGPDGAAAPGSPPPLWPASPTPAPARRQPRDRVRRRHRVRAPHVDRVSA